MIRRKMSGAERGAREILAEAGVAAIEQLRADLAKVTAERDRLAAENAELLAALDDIVVRCDGEEGVRADGSNIETWRQHAAINRARGGGR